MVVDTAIVILIVVVVGFAVLIGIGSAVSGGGGYEEIGRGGLFGEEKRAGGRPAPSPAVHRGEIEAEVRQMVQARNLHRQRRGQAPVDVEAEIARLLDPDTRAPPDPELVEEVRQLVVARNARRERHGKAPLDVEAEVARELREHGA